MYGGHRYVKIMFNTYLFCYRYTFPMTNRDIGAKKGGCKLDGMFGSTTTVCRKFAERFSDCYLSSRLTIYRIRDKLNLVRGTVVIEPNTSIELATTLLCSNVSISHRVYL